MDTVPKFHAVAPQATVSEGLAQGPYVAARAGVEPMTLQTKGVDSTNASPKPQRRGWCIFCPLSRTLKKCSYDPTFACIPTYHKLESLKLFQQSITEEW